MPAPDSQSTQKTAKLEPAVTTNSPVKQNGKGDSPRNCFSNKFRQNYDDIFRKKKK